MKSDLSKVKVGDTIWTARNGWEKVVRLDNDDYPIVTEVTSYTLDGKFQVSDKQPSAFLTNPFEQEEYWAMVSNFPINEVNKGTKRKVIKEKNGVYIAWIHAETDEAVLRATDTVTWQYAQRIPEIPTYTIAEAEAKFKELGVECKIVQP